MGLTEIAEYLIAKGARMDIFVATMLGKMDIVRPMLDAFPNLKTSKGPHGITLLAHAEKVAKKQSQCWSIYNRSGQVNGTPTEILWQIACSTGQQLV